MKCRPCGGGTTKHSQTHLNGWSQSACVDEGIAPLVRYLWSAGCRTLYSCQEGLPTPSSPSMAYVMFSDGASFDKGLTAIWQIARHDENLRLRFQGFMRSDRQKSGWRHEIAVRRAEATYDLPWLHTRHTLRINAEDLPRLHDLLIRS